MPRLRIDQAEGLRRLFNRRPARMISVASACAGVGGTSATVNLGMALAAQGLGVLVIDENAGSANATAALGVTARGDLNDVMHGACALDDVLVTTSCGLAVLPAVEAVRAGPAADRTAEDRLDYALERLSERFDLILTDALSGTAGGLVPVVRAAQEVLLVCSGGSTAITATYALLKALAAGRAPLRYHVLLNRVSDERAGGLIFDNLDRLARGRLDAPLELLGCVARDDSVGHASRLRQPVVATFPNSPAGRAYRRSAGALASGPAVREHAGGFDGFLRAFRGTPLALANAGALR